MSASKIGPYEVVRELGRGGMGVVLEVRHPDLPGRRLALKLISKDAAEGAALERFSREARLLARVKHPNVVGVHSFASADDGRPYLVTDLVEGTNLKQIARSSQVDPARAATIVRTLAGAASALHAAGILHRDLKPENVILEADDTPVLLDFGLAREHDAQRLTQTGTVLGTPAYMSPEQAGGDSPDTIDARTDVYGLGAILFELLAGRPPFEGTPIQIVTAVLRKDPRWPSEDRGDVPADLEAVLRKAMAKEAAARYASAAELGKDLARFAGGERVAAPRPAGRRRAPLALGVALGLAAVVGVTGAILTRGQPATTEPSGASPGDRPTAARRTPRPPAPAWDRDRPVASYRALASWLADPANGDHDHRTRTILTLSQRRSERLRVVAVPEGATEQVFVHFLSNTTLAVLVNNKTVSVVVIDVDGDARVPRWRLAVGRAWNLAVAGSTVVLSGSGGVYRASLDDAAPADGPQELSPLVTFDDGEAIPDPTPGAVDALAISPDRTRAVAAGAYRQALLFDPRADRPAAPRRFGDFPKRVNVCAFSPDGERLVTGTHAVGPSGTVGLWTKDGQPLASTTVSGGVESITFAPDGTYWLIGTSYAGPHRVDGLDALVFEPVPVVDPAPFLALAPGALRRLYSVTGIEAPTQVQVWRTDTEPFGPHRTTARAGRRPTSISLSPDGAILAVCGKLAGDDFSSVELYGVGD